MKHSDDISKLTEALAKAQAELENPPKTKTAHVSGVSKKTGKRYELSYNYADISDVLNVVRPILSKHDLAVFQSTEIRETGLVLITVISHKSGQWMSGEYPVAAAGHMNHQDIGAAMTYARRYALTAMIGIAAEEDTDAQNASPAGVSSAKSSGMKKADARPVYERLQTSLRQCKSLEALEEWAERNKSDLSALPGRWADLLRNEYREAVAFWKSEGTDQ